jgi:ATP-dependent DNA helicase Q4
MVAKLLEQKPTGCGDDFNIDVIQLCEQLNADYDSIRQSLKRLEWQIDEYGTFKAKSGISIEFQTKSFYLKRKCIIDESELDDVNDHLWSRVSSQMNFSHYNFKAIYKILSENSFNSVGAYIDSFPVEGQSESDLIEKKSNSLKQHFNKYFSNQLDLEEFTKNNKLDYETSYSEEKEKHVAGNIKKFIYTYEKDAKLTGVVIARIMHGISTPRYPAEVWGRNRNFWRAHLDVEFERLRDLCTKQLLNC